MDGQGDILIEQRRVGAYLRITAVCEDTGLEVVFMAPPDAGSALIDAVAARKLAHVKAKRATEGAGSSTAPRPPRGVIV